MQLATTLSGLSPMPLMMIAAAFRLSSMVVVTALASGSAVVAEASPSAVVDVALSSMT